MIISLIIIMIIIVDSQDRCNKINISRFRAQQQVIWQFKFSVNKILMVGILTSSAYFIILRISEMLTVRQFH